MKKKKKRISRNSFDIEVTGQELCCQFRKNQNLCFYGPKGTGKNRELCSQEKKKVRNPFDTKSQVWTYGVNFGKIKIFVLMVLKAQV